ncbi:hypothetical protein PHO31112_01913 [Pandoraea horticolens]|uniref:Nucleotidyltransferase family protein n=2 Tax=Pandoraea horticolens TaxID=2508298 RepID=A0A5E4U9P2_9BURK|nr:hypothetical protein PHO31112_01913 [Pandoraea horticolens]
MVRSSWLMPALVAVRELGLPEGCIGAGAVRNLVWDSLHGYPTPSVLPDVDVVYFDPSDTTLDGEASPREKLVQALPNVPWEVTNQARVHLWYEQEFGVAVAPLRSVEDAIGTWPEFATAVGVCLGDDGAIDVIAPHGLDDLFGMIVRRNPARVTETVYRERLAQKRYRDRWPGVTIIDV